MGALTKLERLTLVEDSSVPDSELDLFSGETNRTVCARMKAILQHLPSSTSSSLQHIHFRFILRAFGVGSAGQLIDNFGWDELADVARRGQGLREVRFRFVGRPMGDRYLQGAIESRLEVLQGRGMLRVEFEQ